MVDETQTGQGYREKTGVVRLLEFVALRLNITHSWLWSTNMVEFVAFPMLVENENMLGGTERMLIMHSVQPC
jgi:hypothetical protein